MYLINLCCFYLVKNTEILGKW